VFIGYKTAVNGTEKQDNEKGAKKLTHIQSLVDYYKREVRQQPLKELLSIQEMNDGQR
jgi:hypothetical protein